MTAERKLFAEVYVEGQRIPFNSVNLVVTTNAPAQCTINIPPVPGLIDIPPRALVHVFYTDEFRTGNGEDEEKKLFFEGEVIGHAFNKTPSGRAFSLICHDLSGYFKHVYFYLFTDLQNLASLPGTGGLRILNFAGTSPKSRNYNIIASDNTLSQILSNANVPNVFRDIVETGMQSNATYRDSDLRTKLTRKISFLEDSNILDLYKSKLVAQMFSGQITGSLPAHSELNRILQHTMATYFYYSVVNPLASNSSTAESGIGSYIFKPLTFFSAPPTCNVFFPNQYSSFSFNRNLLSEPTRLHMNTYLIKGLGIPGKVYVAPQELVGKWEDSPLDDIESLKETILGEDDVQDPLDASREDLKGIIPSFYQFEQSEVLRAFLTATNSDRQSDRTGSDGQPISKEDFDTELDRYLSEIAEYELLKQQHAPRTAQIVGQYNPQIVAGFPAVVLDREALTFGEILQISHSISADGAASTTATLGYCRNKDILARELDGDFLPPWISDKYREENIGTAAYPSLLGEEVQSILKPLPDPKNPTQVVVPSSQKEAADFLLDLFDQKREKGTQDSFVRNETFRKVVNKKQVFDVLGAVKVNENEYVNAPGEANPPFRDAVVDVVRPVAVLLRNQKDFRIE